MALFSLPKGMLHSGGDETAAKPRLSSSSFFVLALLACGVWALVVALLSIGAKVLQLAPT